jgi:hypothetical protein
MDHLVQEYIIARIRSQVYSVLVVVPTEDVAFLPPACLPHEELVISIFDVGRLIGSLIGA